MKARRSLLRRIETTVSEKNIGLTSKAICEAMILELGLQPLRTEIDKLLEWDSKSKAFIRNKAKELDPSLSEQEIQTIVYTISEGLLKERYYFDQLASLSIQLNFALTEMQKNWTERWNSQQILILGEIQRQTIVSSDVVDRQLGDTSRGGFIRSSPLAIINHIITLQALDAMGEISLGEHGVSLGSGDGMTDILLSAFLGKIIGIEGEAQLVEQSWKNAVAIRARQGDSVSFDTKWLQAWFSSELKKNDLAIQDIFTSGDWFFSWPWPEQIMEHLILFANCARPGAIMSMSLAGQNLNEAYINRVNTQLKKARLRLVFPTTTPKQNEIKGVTVISKME